MIDKEEIYDKWSKLGLLEGLNVKEGWMDQILVNDRGFGEGVQIEEEIEREKPDYSQIAFPVVRRVAAQTLAGGGWQQSKKQKQKQDRLNKLRKLNGEEPNVVLPDDEFVNGLVSVQPMSAPSPHLFYLDFKYDNKSKINKEIVPKKRNKKHKAIKRIKYKSKLSSHKNKNINRADKFKYILKNNNKKWMISRFLKKKL